MTSFELYTKYRNVGGSNRTSGQKEYANEVLAALWNETLDKNKVFSNIEFVSIIKKMIENAKFYRTIDETRIYVFDAYVFISALYTCVQNKDFTCGAIADDNLTYLFKQVQFDDVNRINFLDNIYSIINKIETIINMDIEFARMNYTVGSQYENELKGSEEDFLREREKKNDNVFEAKRTAAYIDLKANARRKVNKEIIDKWHFEIDDIGSTLKSIQPDVSKMLENIMGFSDKITEKYVLQFARMQVDLYNFISDNYMYHKEVSENSGNQDYINAVSNYEEFLYSLSDSLAVFGVEEIVSSPGDSFEGKIHEAPTNDFSSRSAVIKKSVRSGYRYKDIIIQKEKVEI